jgi:hypothetical protein
MFHNGSDEPLKRSNMVRRTVDANLWSAFDANYSTGGLEALRVACLRLSRTNGIKTKLCPEINGRPRDGRWRPKCRLLCPHCRGFYAPSACYIFNGKAPDPMHRPKRFPGLVIAASAIFISISVPAHAQKPISAENILDLDELFDVFRKCFRSSYRFA